METGSISIDPNTSLTIQTDSKVHIDSEIVMKWANGGETKMKIMSSADLADVPTEQQEQFLRSFASQFNKQVNVHTCFRSDGTLTPTVTVPVATKPFWKFW